MSERALGICAECRAAKAFRRVAKALLCDRCARELHAKVYRVIRAERPRLPRQDVETWADDLVDLGGARMIREPTFKELPPSEAKRILAAARALPSA